MDGIFNTNNGIFKHVRMIHQIKTYKLEFGLHKIRTIPNYMYHQPRTEVKVRRARGEKREKITPVRIPLLTVPYWLLYNT